MGFIKKGFKITVARKLINLGIESGDKRTNERWNKTVGAHKCTCN